MENIQKAIDEHINSLNKASSVSQKPGQSPQTQPSDKTRQTLWGDFAQDIWNGMICALTYKDDDNGPKGVEKKPQKIENPENLWDSGKNEPKKPQYQYQTAKLEEEISGPRTTQPPSSSGEKTTLTDFISRPPYFRYLEEWGQHFCTERKKRLQEVEKGCKVNEDDRRDGKKCSGYGEDCHDNVFNNNYTTFPDFYCPECGKHCSSYRKWIERKKIEFEEQKSAYGEQKKKCQTQRNDGGLNDQGNGDCGTVTTCDTAKEFLQKLGSCKNNNRNENAEDNKKIFDDEGETFQHAKDCKPCSQFRVKCKGNDHCDTTKGEGCENKTYITADDIKNNKDSAEDIGMLVSDNNIKKYDGLEEACKNANIFKGFRKDVWTCGNVCGYNVCKPKNVNGKTFEGQANGENQIIFIRALFKRWLEYFLQDYNKIKHKISHCTNNNEQSPCINACQKKCECVSKWIEQKKEEWKKIKNHYKTQNENGDNNMKSLVTDILSGLYPQTDVNKAIKPCGTLTAFETSCGLNGTESSKKKDGNEDAIDCMINRLTEKITSCLSSTSAENKAQPCEESSPEPDDEPFEEENTVEAPKICPEQAPPKQEEEDACKAAAEEPAADSTPAGPSPSSDNFKPTEEEAGKKPTSEEPVIKPEEEAPAPAPAREPFDSTILQTTIPFGVALALGSIAFFFMKKKTKSSVGNLFQILQIPKGDYDIPTLKSSNRYIPYVSDRYKGKTYIYMEGDTSGDEGKYAFMSDTTDVTSSESEYEELDINDIYVPGSPKYKTLIEVVLEPSKRDTQNDIHNDIPSDIPSDIPNSDTPPPITDDEWNKLKKDFISNMLQNAQNTEPNILRDNVDNNTHPTTSHHNVEEKPFIMSIHDRNLFSGEEYNYDMFNSGNNPINISDSTNSMDSLTSNNHGPYNDKNDLYSGIDLINDALSGNHIDIYDEMLKRKENELFGTQHHPKNITSNRVVTQTSSDDPLHNQLNLFHQWLDRHRDMCEKWKNNHERLPKLKELWENETHSGDINSGIPSGNHVLNTDVSIQIDMNNPKPKNEFKNMDTTPNKSTMDTMLDDLEKYNEPYYYDFYKDDIYYDVNDDDKTSMDNNNNLVDKNNPVDSNNSTYNHRNPADINKNFVDKNNQNQHPIEKPTKIQIEMNSNNREVVEQQYPIADIWNI
ncbi:hypothetical protein PFAG_01650 [Plasmodium falciparum Santa Lucia]|uniref:Erythrocyte membrane protein 1, PfEMP1 n=1 Tax=Plasmodium falciparum Santa Lucia TaxID=478859 RepID=W7FYM3_PLAFA|nr:hypothetical protein PFAG_01650 [Plasmodium falciparum Santa Lucia]